MNFCFWIFFSFCHLSFLDSYSTRPRLFRCTPPFSRSFEIFIASWRCLKARSFRSTITSRKSRFETATALRWTNFNETAIYGNRRGHIHTHSDLSLSLSLSSSIVKTITHNAGLRRNRLSLAQRFQCLLFTSSVCECRPRRCSCVPRSYVFICLRRICVCVCELFPSHPRRFSFILHFIVQNETVLVEWWRLINCARHFLFPISKYYFFLTNESKYQRNR